MFKKFQSGSRVLRMAVVTVAVAGLAACAQPFNADVSRFQTQLPAPQGVSFAVVPEDPSMIGGLEFAQYARYVAQRMSQLGYTPAASPETADLLVKFDYGVSDGRERIRTTGGLGYGGFGPYGFGGFGRYGYGGFGGFGPAFYGRRAWAYGFYDPWFGGPDISSYTIYNSDIDLIIERRATGERLFEGEAQAVSTSNRLQYLVPNLVEAMFTDFPGDSGRTVRISIKPENMPAQRR